VTSYQSTFHTSPGTWGTFTYDSVELLANAVKQAGGWHQAVVATTLDHTTGYAGITGAITIDPASGNRTNSPVVILDVNPAGKYVIDPTWAQGAGFPIPPSS
jgi:ABC-type branched-subunit amino acid transport system substrate-binding protein